MNKELIIRMAREAGIAHHGLGWTCWEGQLERFAALVAAVEREACAKLCEEEANRAKWNKYLQCHWQGRSWATTLRRPSIRKA